MFFFVTLSAVICLTRYFADLTGRAITASGNRNDTRMTVFGYHKWICIRIMMTEPGLRGF